MTDTSEYMYDKLKKVGKDPVVVSHSGLRDLLRAAGVQTPKKVLTREQREWESMEDPSDETKGLFLMLWNKLGGAGKLYDLQEKIPEVRLYVEAPGKSSISFGNVSNDRIYINKSIVGSEKERHTLLECIVRYISATAEGSEEFNTFLVEIADHYMNNVPTFQPIS